MSGPVALLTWAALRLDALDVEAQSRFWAAVTGLEVADGPDGRRLVGPTPRHTVRIDPVDRPHVVKNRVHPDVDCASVADLLDLGARVLAAAEDTGLGWTTMADPEGNEFCAFVRAPDRPPAYRLHGLGVDCADPEAQARWWGGVLGAEPVHDANPGDEAGWWTLAGVAADERTTLDFNVVPEPRTQPDRVRWDLVGRAEEVLARGASYVGRTAGRTVLADPEGNEFGVVVEP